MFEDLFPPPFLFSVDGRAKEILHRAKDNVDVNRREPAEMYGGTGPKEVLTTFILQPINTFCPNKLNPASEGREHFFWACTFVR